MQKGIFLEEAGMTMLQYGLVTDEEMCQMEADALRRYRGQPWIREVVARMVPQDATVLVVSKGDEELVQLEGRVGWHFPQDAAGTYAGYYPADSAEAIRQLEGLRARGAGYLLFPRPAFWWLEHYGAFRQHLDQHYPLVHQDDICLLYAL